MMTMEVVTLPPRTEPPEAEVVADQIVYLVEKRPVVLLGETVQLYWRASLLLIR